MVGNDVSEDMIPAREVGMQVFLLDTFLINKKDLVLEQFSRGGFAELKDFLLNRV